MSLMTTQIPNYNSLYWDPYTSWVDAFAQTDLSLSNNYVNAVLQQAMATVIAPMWPAQILFQKLKSRIIENPIPLSVSPRTIICVGPHAEPLKNRSLRLFSWRIFGRCALDASVDLNMHLLNQPSVSCNPL